MDKIKKHFDTVAKDYDYYKVKNGYYYSNLKTLIGLLIPSNKKVLEVGCGTGDLINHINPKSGYGMDLSPEMIKSAKRKFGSSKQITFSTKYPNSKYDYVFMCDVIEHLENPKKVFSEIRKNMRKDSFLVNTMANPIWEPLLMLGEKIGYKMPEGPHVRISYNEIKSILNVTGFKVIKHGYTLLFPIYIPIVSTFINKYLGRYLNKYAFIEYFVAKKK